MPNRVLGGANLRGWNMYGKWLWDRLSPHGLYIWAGIALAGGQLVLICLPFGFAIALREDADRYGTVTSLAIAAAVVFTGIVAALCKPLVRPRSAGPPATTWTRTSLCRYPRVRPPH